MAGFLSNSDISVVTSHYTTHFDTFKKQIVIVKEPIKTIVTSNTNNSPVFGYGEDSQPSSSITYTPVTGVFNAQVTVNLDQKTVELEEAKNTIGKGRVRIKVEKNCRDFIEDGRKTEGVQYGGQTYNTITFDGLQDFFGMKYYIYFIERSM